MSKYGGRFPLGTLVINVTGSFLIGVLMTLLTERLHPHPNWRLFLVVGILGGYTTFSSFEYETLPGRARRRALDGAAVRDGQRDPRLSRRMAGRAPDGSPLTPVEAHMLTKGPAKKVTIFINEDTQHHMTALHDSIMTFLMHKGVSGATATRAYSGFGVAPNAAHAQGRSAGRSICPSASNSWTQRRRWKRFCRRFTKWFSDGLIEVQDTTVVKIRPQNQPSPSPNSRTSANPDPPRCLRVFMGEADKWHDAAALRCDRETSCA